MRKAVAEYGYCVSPDDCFLALRGLRTIGVRMRHQQQSALKVARWLQARPEVMRVLYPALESDPGYALWKRDFSGAASLFGVILEPVERQSGRRDDRCAGNVRHRLELGRLRKPRASAPNPAKIRTATRWSPGGPLIRLHIGLEDTDDLIADLERGFTKLKT